MSDWQQINDAAAYIHRDAMDPWVPHLVGLCAAFNLAGVSDARHLVPRYLFALGGRNDDCCYFWPRNAEGHAQRLTFLAFMLAWLENP